MPQDWIRPLLPLPYQMRQVGNVLTDGDDFARFSADPRRGERTTPVQMSPGGVRDRIGGRRKLLVRESLSHSASRESVPVSSYAGSKSRTNGGRAGADMPPRPHRNWTDAGGASTMKRDRNYPTEPDGENLR